MGGILVATVLTIFVLPAGYALFFGREPASKGGEKTVPDASNGNATAAAGDASQETVLAAE